MKKLSHSSKNPESLAPESGLDLSDEVAAEEENNELDVPDQEKQIPGRQPEVTDSELEDVTTWDEPTGQFGSRIEPIGLEDENEADEELIEEGLEIAEDELRDADELDESLEEAEEEEAEIREDEE